MCEKCIYKRAWKVCIRHLLAFSSPEVTTSAMANLILLVTVVLGLHAALVSGGKLALVICLRADM